MILAIRNWKALGTKDTIIAIVIGASLGFPVGLLLIRFAEFCYGY
jgi:hypothetical protein